MNRVDTELSDNAEAQTALRMAEKGLNASVVGVVDALTAGVHATLAVALETRLLAAEMRTANKLALLGGEHRSTGDMSTDTFTRIRNEIRGSLGAEEMPAGRGFDW